MQMMLIVYNVQLIYLLSRQLHIAINNYFILNVGCFSHLSTVFITAVHKSYIASCRALGLLEAYHVTSPLTRQGSVGERC